MDLIEQIENYSRLHADKSRLLSAAQTLSSRYRAGIYQNISLTKEERYAYVQSRMPATYKAVHNVLTEIKSLIPYFAPLSMKDFGAGPATASWAAADLWDSLRDFTMIEKDEGFSQIARELSLKHPRLSLASYRCADLCSFKNESPFDLGIIAYALQEISSEQHADIVERIFTYCQAILVIIEPGTPRGFANIAKIRAALLKKGAHIVAPCTHALACPLSDTDWCHFSARLLRNPIHRRLKGASLGYEDEKCSYLVLSKEPAAHSGARVICNPIKRGGHLILDLCTEGQRVREVVARSNPKFSDAKKLRWGSLLSL